QIDQTESKIGHLGELRSELLNTLDVKKTEITQAGEEIEMRELDEDLFRTAEELGIDLSRPERGSDEEDARREAERAARFSGSV
ncbi:MAG: hypothetical protein ACERLM_03205, partial [Acidimicrobiales bacterium]